MVEESKTSVRLVRPTRNAVINCEWEHCVVHLGSSSCPLSTVSATMFSFSTSHFKIFLQEWQLWSFWVQDISSIEVLTALRKLPSGKSVGRDLVSNELLCACSAVCSSLATLFNMSLSQGSFPAVLKSAIITPILKAGKNASLPSPFDQLLFLAAFRKSWNVSCTSSYHLFCLKAKLCLMNSSDFFMVVLRNGNFFLL